MVVKIRLPSPRFVGWVAGIATSLVALVVDGDVARAADESASADAKPGSAGQKDEAIRSERGAAIGRPHTIAEFEAGIIALPAAPISAAQRGGDTPLGTIGTGDATLQTGMHLLYRGDPEWALGAAAFFAPSPTSDDEYGGLTGLSRTHSRSYMWFAVEGRYVPLRTKWIEGWVGLSAGGVIVADRFGTDTGEQKPAVLGTPDVTVRTEGYAVGVHAGASWLLTARWVAGAAIRADRWFLPGSPQCSPIGDCATLTGSVEAFEFGLRVGYRIPL